MKYIASTAGKIHPLHRRLAFTLIELLVVVMITLILTGITVATINITIDGDKVRSAARQVQSYLEGARNRAIFSKAPRGVRFLLDPVDNRTVTSLVYIAPTDAWTVGTVRLERPDGDNDGNPAASDSDDPLNFAPFNTDADGVYVLRGYDGDSNQYTKDTGWKDLYDRGVLQDGCRIQIPYGTGQWYVVDTRLLANADTSDGNPPVRLLLQQAYRESADHNDASDPVRAFNSTATLKYRLELLPAPLANQEPVQLPRGTVIHLDRSSTDPDGQWPSGSPTRDPNLRGNRLPNSWKQAITPAQAWKPRFRYNGYCDLMFSPRGSITGPEASSGLIHLYIADQKDSNRDRIDWEIRRDANDTEPWTAPEAQPGFTASDPGPGGTAYQRGDRVIVSIFTRTGAITTNPIFVDASNNEIQGQRFRYSETGEVAGR